MGWVQQQQFRHQYSMDGSSSMAWQPTAVYKSARKKGKESSFGDTLDTMSMFFALFVAFVIYHEVGKIHFVAHLSSGVRPVILWSAAGVSFAVASMLATTRIVQVLMGIGVTVFCAGLFFWPAIIHFFK